MGDADAFGGKEAASRGAGFGTGDVKHGVSASDLRRLLGPLKSLPRPVVVVVATESSLGAQQRLVSALRSECSGSFSVLARVLEDGVRPDLRAWATEDAVDQRGAPDYDGAMAPGAEPASDAGSLALASSVADMPVNLAGAPAAIDEGLPPTHRELQRLLASGRCAVTFATVGRTPAGRSRCARALAMLRRLRPRPRVILLLAPAAPRAGMLRGADGQIPSSLAIPGVPARTDVFGAALWRD